MAGRMAGYLNCSSESSNSGVPQGSSAALRRVRRIPSRRAIHGMEPTACSAGSCGTTS